MTDMFARPKLSTSCLSSWQVARLALAELREVEAARAEEHVQTCAHCNARLELERAAHEAAAREPVSQALRDRAHERRRLPWRRLTVAAAAVAAAATVLLVAPSITDQPQRGERTKGSTAVSLSVLRQGNVLFDEAAAEKVQGLVPGDRVRVRVRAGQGAWVRAEGLEHRRWVVYFAGALPPDGWLPIGVTVTLAGETRLRFTTCARRDPGVNPKECTTQTFDLGEKR